MGVATLITVMTIVQGANLYVEQKIANLGTNVFQIARTPFAVTDFTVVVKALRNKRIQLEDMAAVAEGCPHCEYVGASTSGAVNTRYGDRELDDGNLIRPHARRWHRSTPAPWRWGATSRSSKSSTQPRSA